MGYNTTVTLLLCAPPWVFATLVAFTDFFANRSAKITASIAGLSLSPEVIQTIVASLGATTEYKHVDYRACSHIL